MQVPLVVLPYPIKLIVNHVLIAVRGTPSGPAAFGGGGRRLLTECGGGGGWGSESAGQGLRARVGVLGLQ